jgi:hypothetical protein
MPSKFESARNRCVGITALLVYVLAADGTDDCEIRTSAVKVLRGVSEKKPSGIPKGHAVLTNASVDTLMHPQKALVNHYRVCHR